MYPYRWSPLDDAAMLLFGLISLVFFTFQIYLGFKILQYITRALDSYAGTAATLGQILRLLERLGSESARNSAPAAASAPDTPPPESLYVKTVSLSTNDISEFLQGLGHTLSRDAYKWTIQLANGTGNNFAYEIDELKKRVESVARSSDILIEWKD